MKERIDRFDGICTICLVACKKEKKTFSIRVFPRLLSSYVFYQNRDRFERAHPPGIFIRESRITCDSSSFFSDSDSKRFCAIDFKTVEGDFYKFHDMIIV